jgi:hypothetical protein
MQIVTMQNARITGGQKTAQKIPQKISRDALPLES